MGKLICLWNCKNFTLWNDVYFGCALYKGLCIMVWVHRSFVLVFVCFSCAICPQGWLNKLYSIFSKLQVGALKVQNPQTKFDHPLNMSTTQRFVFYLLFCHESFLKHFVNLADSFLNIKKKIDAISLVLKACHFIGLQWMQKVLNTDTFKHQMHKKAMFCCSMTYGNSQ